jgi:PAS domain-containing protein
MKMKTQNITKYDRSKLISVLNSVGDAILICDIEGDIDFANAEACEILERDSDSLIGQSLNQVMVI